MGSVITIIFLVMGTDVHVRAADVNDSDRESGSEVTSCVKRVLGQLCRAESIDPADVKVVTVLGGECEPVDEYSDGQAVSGSDL